MKSIKKQIALLTALVVASSAFPAAVYADEPNPGERVDMSLVFAPETRLDVYVDGEWSAALSDSYGFGDKATITAPTNSGSKVFSHWTADGSIISYNRTLNLTMNAHTTLYAVYASAAPTSQNTAGFTSITRTNDGKKISFQAIADKSATAAGIVYSTTATGESLKIGGSNVTNVAAEKITDSTTTMPKSILDDNGCYTLKVTPESASTVYHARAYVTVGGETTYGDIKDVKLSDLESGISLIANPGSLDPENNLDDLLKGQTANIKSVTFDANGGTGTMASQAVFSGKSAKLKANTFTRSGYNFNGWNTKANGSGTSYSDEQSVSLSEDTILYAQWKEQYTHTHSYKWTVTKPATCTETGTESGKCSCGATKTRTIPALGHNYDPETHICANCGEVDPEAFPAYKTAQNEAVDALAETTDSAASKKLITDAKAAIDAVEYDTEKTFAENAAVIDAIIEQLKTDLDAQRIKDNAPGEFAKYKTEQKAAADDLSKDGDSDAVKALITKAKSDIDALVYDEEKSFEENKADVDSIIEKLEADIAKQREADKSVSDFEKYKTEQKAAAEALSKDGDSDAAKALIAKAKEDITALAYDAEKSLDENKAAVDTIITKLKSDLKTQRAIDSGEGLSDAFEAYKKSQKEYADTLANESDNASEQALITAAKSAIDALKYDESKTFDENKAAVDAIIENLRRDIEAYWASVTFTVKFNTMGGSLAEHQTVAYGKKVSLPEVTREGYDLVGWTVDGKTFDPETPVKSDLVLSAEWKAIEYDVILYFNGTEYRKIKVEHGKKVDLPAIPVSEGKSFFGWTTDPELNDGFTAFTPITGNLKLYSAEKDKADVLIDGTPSGSIDDALKHLDGKEDYIILYKDQTVSKITFPQSGTDIVISGGTGAGENNSAIVFNKAANIKPNQKLTLSDITVKAVNKKGKLQNITLTAAKGKPIMLDDVTFECKKTTIGATKGDVFIGDINTANAGTVTVKGSANTKAEIDGEAEATAISGFKTLTIKSGSTFTVTKTLSVNELYIEQGATLVIGDKASVTVKKTLGGNGTIRFAGSFKPVAINGTISAGTLISLEGNSLADKQLFTSKLINLNEVFDVSAVIPSDDYALCTKSSKVTLSKCYFSVNGKKYSDWTVMMNEIAKSDGTVTVELINDANIGSAFKFPSKPKYDKIIINGSGKTLTFKGKSVTLTSDTTFTNITVKSESGAWTVFKKGKTLDYSTAELVNVTEK